MLAATGATGPAGPAGPAGPTGPAGGLTPGELLFNVVGTTGIVPVTVGEDMVFTSSTLDITVTPGSAIVTIDMPTGGTGGTGGITGPTGPAGPTGAYQLGKRQ